MSAIPGSHTEDVFKRPEVIDMGGALRLRPYGGDRDVDAAWPWYQDIDTVRLIDGQEARPYTREQVRSMYAALSAQGEVYIIEERKPLGAWQPIGDVTLAPHTLPIVLHPEARGRVVGRAVILSLIERARHLGWAELQVREILPGNTGSTALFEGVGFRPTASPPPAMAMVLRD